MIILSIETSCDETAVAIIKRSRGKSVRFEILSNKILSQIDLHTQYGGVFPMLAKREHAKALTQMIAEALDEANLLNERANVFHLPMSQKNHLKKILEKEPEMLKAMTILFEGIQKPNIDAIAITTGPGLEPALWVGVNAAMAIQTIWNIPLYPINHMEGHIIASLLKEEKSNYEISKIEYPACALLISGGHTEIVRISKQRNYKIIGHTRDDAIGEAFDKVARMLSLPYPGGPQISTLAEKARNEGIIASEELRLPRPMINSKDLFMSFSGLKTAVMVRLKKYENISEEIKKMISLEFENSVTDVLTIKIKQAIYETRAKTLIVGGGVSANKHIRKSLQELTNEEGVTLYIPEKDLSTDNGLMIAATGLIHIDEDVKPRVKLMANGAWSIENN